MEKSVLFIALETSGRRAKDIETTLNNWFKNLPRNLFKSITFDCEKEFSIWKSLSNEQAILVFFADPGCPSQNGLNEHQMVYFKKMVCINKWILMKSVKNLCIQWLSIGIKSLKKSLDYKTLLEVFLENVSGLNISSLNW